MYLHMDPPNLLNWFQSLPLKVKNEDGSINYDVLKEIVLDECNSLDKLDLPGLNKKYGLQNWTIKIDSYYSNCFHLFGTLICLDDDKTIMQNFCAGLISSRPKLHHVETSVNVYKLFGKLCDPNNVIPVEVKNKFGENFPANWEVILKTWTNIVEEEKSKTTTSTITTRSLIADKSNDSIILSDSEERPVGNLNGEAKTQSKRTSGDKKTIDKIKKQAKTKKEIEYLKKWTIAKIGNSIILKGHILSPANEELAEDLTVAGSIQSVDKNGITTENGKYVILKDLYDPDNLIPDPIKEMLTDGIPTNWQQLLNLDWDEPQSVKDKVSYNSKGIEKKNTKDQDSKKRLLSLDNSEILSDAEEGPSKKIYRTLQDEGKIKQSKKNSSGKKKSVHQNKKQGKKADNKLLKNWKVCKKGKQLILKGHVFSPDEGTLEKKLTVAGTILCVENSGLITTETGDYYLVGDFYDFNKSIPNFVKEKINDGFPQNWKDLVKIDWKKKVTANPTVFEDSRNDDLFGELDEDLKQDGLNINSFKMASPGTFLNSKAESDVSVGNNNTLHNHLAHMLQSSGTHATPSTSQHSITTNAIAKNVDVVKRINKIKKNKKGNCEKPVKNSGKVARGANKRKVSAEVNKIYEELKNKPSTSTATPKLIKKVFRQKKKPEDELNTDEENSDANSDMDVDDDFF